MSTRGFIGQEQEDGTLRVVYAHWDNYPTGSGATLRTHYRDRSKVQELLDLGNISSLRDDIGEQHDFDSYEDDSPQRVNRWTTFYGRDRGEADQEAGVYSDYEKFAVILRNTYCEYAYIQRLDGSWVYRDLSETIPASLDEWAPLDFEAMRKYVREHIMDNWQQSYMTEIDKMEADEQNATA